MEGLLSTGPTQSSFCLEPFLKLVNCPWNCVNWFKANSRQITVDSIYKFLIGLEEIYIQLLNTHMFCSFKNFTRLSISLTDSLCLSQPLCVCQKQTVCVYHRQSVSVTYGQCLSQIVCDGHRQFVSDTDWLCVSHTVCFCPKQFVSVTKNFVSVRESMSLLQTVCVCIKYSSW